MCLSILTAVVGLLAVWVFSKWWFYKKPQDMNDLAKAKQKEKRNEQLDRNINPLMSEPLSSTESNKWTLWRYDCRDFPEHKCLAKPCAFCDQVIRLKGVTKGKANESTDRWDSYLKKEKTFDDEQILTNTLAGLLPSKLVKDVFFNRKLGFAIFRGDIEPKRESAENINGDVFQLLLLATSGRKSAALIRKFDYIFTESVRLTFDLPASVACHVNGLFLRFEMNPGKGLEAEPNPYGNQMDLPIIAKLEVWIGDRSQKALVWEKLITEIQAKIDKLEMPSNTIRPFIYNHKFNANVHAKAKKPVRKN